jgi:hypothetical protein
VSLSQRAKKQHGYALNKFTGGRYGYQPPNGESTKKILDIQLNRLRSRLTERHIQIELTAEAATHLAREGYGQPYSVQTWTATFRLNKEANK